MILPFARGLPAFAVRRTFPTELLWEWRKGYELSVCRGVQARAWLQEFPPQWGLLLGACLIHHGASVKPSLSSARGLMGAKPGTATGVRAAR